MILGSRHGALTGSVVVALGAAAVSCDGAPPGDRLGGDGGPGEAGVSAGVSEGVKAISVARTESCDETVCSVCRTDAGCVAGSACLPVGAAKVCLKPCNPFRARCEGGTTCGWHGTAWACAPAHDACCLDADGDGYGAG